MSKQTQVTPQGTQITKRTPDIVPNLDEPCQAVVTTQVMICEPMSDKSWRLVTSFQDNYNIILDEREGGAAHCEVIDRITEIKQKWQNKQQIISLENLLATGPPNSSKMEINS